MLQCVGRNPTHGLLGFCMWGWVVFRGISALPVPCMLANTYEARPQEPMTPLYIYPCCINLSSMETGKLKLWELEIEKITMIVLVEFLMNRLRLSYFQS